MLISIDAENALDKIQHLCMILKIHKIGIGEHNIIKSILNDHNKAHN